MNSIFKMAWLAGSPILVRKFQVFIFHICLRNHLSIAMLKKINVILPPKKLQDDFATFVEHVDQQKQTVQQSLEKLELLKKALMQEYFG